MNGDLLTKVNFGQLLNFHAEHRSEATMCVREYDFQVPYGVVNVDGHSITSLLEKPVHKFFVNAGIYALQPSALEQIPRDEFYDMTTLFERLIELKQTVCSFPIREYWMDIGQLSDFERANAEYRETFA
jgi:NDP-sugar pyrophosphorylase family protein